MPIPLPVLAVQLTRQRLARSQTAMDDRLADIKAAPTFHSLLWQGVYFWVFCHGLRR